VVGVFGMVLAGCVAEFVEEDGQQFNGFPNFDCPFANSGVCPSKKLRQLQVSQTLQLRVVPLAELASCKIRLATRIRAVQHNVS